MVPKHWNPPKKSFILLDIQASGTLCNCVYNLFFPVITSSGSGQMATHLNFLANPKSGELSPEHGIMLFHPMPCQEDTVVWMCKQASKCRCNSLFTESLPHMVLSCWYDDLHRQLLGPLPPSPWESDVNVLRHLSSGEDEACAHKVAKSPYLILRRRVQLRNRVKADWERCGQSHQGFGSLMWLWEQS